MEFHRQADGSWRPFPVEYKHGRPKIERCDEVQLCAQAICLEEMLSIEIPAGALFYGRTRRRKDVMLDASLRQATVDSSAALHRLFESRLTPPAEPGPKCGNCSLHDLCLPHSTSGRGPSIHQWLDGQIREVDDSHSRESG